MLVVDDDRDWIEQPVSIQPDLPGLQQVITPPIVKLHHYLIVQTST